jgi:hypothetical protein
VQVVRPNVVGNEPQVGERNFGVGDANPIAIAIALAMLRLPGTQPSELHRVAMFLQGPLRRKFRNREIADRGSR